MGQGRGWEEVEGEFRIALGKNCRAIGRRAAMLTEIIPRLHSPTDIMRHVTLSSTVC
jgi:hypothetical protein